MRALFVGLLQRLLGPGQLLGRLSVHVVCRVVVGMVMLSCTACAADWSVSPEADHQLALPLSSSAASHRREVEGAVIEVIDGDTIRVRIDETVRRVRYIGIDAPERDEPLGSAATEANHALVAGEVVLLEKDVSDKDDYGRWLRYVFLPDGLFVNGELVRRGLARAKAYPPDLGRQSSLAALEEEARAAGRGVWEKTIATAALGAARVQIVGVDKYAEVVVLTNVGDRAQDLTDWTLVSERGGEVCPLVGTLAPSATLRVWARVEDAHRGGHNCGFTEKVWNNREPDPAALYDAAGGLVDEFP